MTEDENGFRTYESDEDLIEDSRNRPPSEIDTGSLIQSLERTNVKLARIAELTYDVNSASPYDFDTGWNDAMAAVRAILGHESGV